MDLDVIFYLKTTALKGLKTTINSMSVAIKNKIFAKKHKIR